MSTGRLAVRALLFAALAPGSVTVLAPYLILHGERRTSLPLGPVRFAGIPPIVLGGSILVWCFVDFVLSGRGTPAPWDAPGALVTRGLYRIVRNPMYVGILSTLTGEAVLFRSVWLLGYATLVWFVFHLFVTVYEEPELIRRFGTSYEAYRSHVNRWVPRPPRRPA